MEKLARFSDSNMYMSAFVGPGQLLAFKKETLLAIRVDNFWYGLDVALKQSAFSSVTALVISPFNFSLLRETETLSATVLSGGPA